MKDSRPAVKPQIEDDNEYVCFECGKPLKSIWCGELACFCKWGGVQPTVDMIIEAVDGTRWN